MKLSNFSRPTSKTERTGQEMAAGSFYSFRRSRNQNSKVENQEKASKSVMNHAQKILFVSKKKSADPNLKQKEAIRNQTFQNTSIPKVLNQ